MGIMTDVRSPRLLDSLLGEKARLHPVSLSLELSLENTNQATMVLAEDEEHVGLHDFVEIYTQNGSAGIYRVTGIKHDYTKQTTLTLLHVIDTLTDQIYPGDVEFSGTVEAFLRDILSKQTREYWVLGTCEDSGNYVASISFTSLRSLLKDVLNHEQDYYFTYDTSSFPWTINLLRKDESIANEFRLARNVQSCNITMDDSDLCTRLYLAIDTDTNNTNTGVKTTSTTVSVFDNAEAQNTYGIVAKTSSINTADYPDPAAYAQRFLADRSKPHLQITIDGLELYQITGDQFDELKLGRICRVTLPDYGDVFSERIISITYPDLVNNPEQVTVELADSAYSAVSTISTLASTAQATAAAQSVTAKTTASQIHTAKADLIKTDGVLHEAGIELDPTGVFVFAKEEGALGKALSFVDLTAQGGRTMFTDAFEKDANGKLIVKSASGMSYRKNNVEVGLFDNDNLTAGIMIKRINGGEPGDSEVIIKATKVDLGDYATVVNLNATNAEISNLKTGQSHFTAVHSDGPITAGGQGTFATLSVGGAIWASKSMTGIGSGTVTTFLGTADADLSHYHTVTFSDGTITIGGTTQTAPGPFDIAATTWYQNKIAAAKDAVLVEVDKDANWTTVDANTGNYTRKIRAMKDGVTAEEDEISAQSIWNLGWNAARSWSEARSHRVISGCTNLGTMELFSYNAATERYYSQGSHYWRYGGSAVTYYELPASK